MTTPAIAPQIPTYASYTPYITSAEFLAAPTGVDVSQLIPSGSNITQEAALADLIGRASSQADVICQKTLAATLDVQSGTYRLRQDGEIWVPVNYTPIVQVNAVSVGCDPANLTALTDLSRIRIGEKVVKIPLCGVRTRSRGFGWEAYAEVTYVNGWAHSTLAAGTAVGAQSISPVSVLGLVPGLPVTIKDGANTETAIVGASYVVGSSVVPLAVPLQYPHAAGATVSALPPVVKDAVLDLCKWLVKSRGSKGIAMGSIKGQPLTTANAKTQESDPGGVGDYRSAVRALTPLKRSR